MLEENNKQETKQNHGAVNKQWVIGAKRVGTVSVSALRGRPGAGGVQEFGKICRSQGQLHRDGKLIGGERPVREKILTT